MTQDSASDIRERSESQHPEESCVSHNSTKISLKTNKKVRPRQVWVTAAARHKLESATIWPRQVRNCKTNKTCRKSLFKTSLTHKPTRQRQIQITPTPTRDKPHPMYKFHKTRVRGCFQQSWNGVYVMSWHFQCGVCSCGDFSCTTVTLQVFSKCHMPFIWWRWKSTDDCTSFTTPCYHQTKKNTALLLVAAQACTDIRGAVPTAATSLLDFDYISGVICHQKEGCNIEIGQNVVMHKSVTKVYVSELASALTRHQQTST